MRRGAGLETADPSALATDLVDGVAPVGLRRRARSIGLRGARAGPHRGVRARWRSCCSSSPVLLVALATLLVGGSWRVAGWLSVCAVLVAAVLALAAQPAVGARVDVGRRHRRPARRRRADARRSSWRRSAPTAIRFGLLALALYVPVLAALAISRAWRLTWSARGAALVVGVRRVDAARRSRRARLRRAARRRCSRLRSRSAWRSTPPPWRVASATDVLGRGFGWRQPVGILGNAAIVSASCPPCWRSATVPGTRPTRR